MKDSRLLRRLAEWTDYYERFNYFSSNTVRDGCYPRIMQHAEPTGKAIVLVHGLSDSPYFMTAIGTYFFNTLGCDVYMPLLHCHGLKKPQGMEEVELEEWKANVGFAIQTAAARSEEVSLGGLSTGGTLSLYMAMMHPDVTGTLYLFSAALDLAGGPMGLIGEVKERLLRTFWANLLDKNEPLIGENPYRYSHVDKDGAQELARLIKETDVMTACFSAEKPFPKRIFAAHSESDETADIAGIENLNKVSAPGRFNFFRILKKHNVAHASLVLQEPVTTKAGKILEEANPQFQEMMEAAVAF
ncbi:MAG: alpha/beta hydrolase [Candidatus Electrothrix sp. AR4]|nr:alpha/beta hydrolase [Candidatus Electrothrix sp. AR4]